MNGREEEEDKLESFMQDCLLFKTDDRSSSGTGCPSWDKSMSWLRFSERNTSVCTLCFYHRTLIAQRS